MTLDEKCAVFGGAISMRQVVGLGQSRWLSAAFVESDAARSRLRRWADAGCPSGPFEQNVIAVGRGFRAIVRDVERQLPPPVSWHAARHVVIVSTGKRSGFCSVFPTLSLSDPVEALRCVAVNEASADIATTVAHELAHAWTGPVVETGATCTSAGMDLVIEAIELRAERLGADGLTWHAREEALAHVLAAEWGFHGGNADVARLRAYGPARYVQEGLRE